MKSVFDVRVRNGPNRLGYLVRARARFWLALRSLGSLDRRLLCSLLLFMMIECRSGPEFTLFTSSVQFSFGSMRSPICRPLFSRSDSNFFSAKCDYKMHKQSTNQFHVHNERKNTLYMFIQIYMYVYVWYLFRNMSKSLPPGLFSFLLPLARLIVLN